MASPFRSGRSGRLQTSDLRIKRYFGFSQRITGRFFGDPALTASLIDDFNDNSIDAAKWQNNSGARVTEVNARLEITTLTTAGYYSIQSKNPLSLYSSAVSVKITSAGNQALSSFEFYPISISNADYSNKLEWVIAGGTCFMYKRIGGVGVNLGSSFTYNSTTHLYFRIREREGFVYFDTSNGTTWTNRNVTPTPVSLNAVFPLLQLGTYSTEASTTVGYWEDFNIAGATYTLTADPGTFTLAGIATNLRYGRRLLADVRTYSLSGVGTVLARILRLTAAVQTYALTGQTAGLLAVLRLVAAQANYTLSGVGTVLTYQKLISRILQENGSFILQENGSKILLEKYVVGAGSYTLTAAPASYTLTGTATALKLQRRLVATNQVYTVSATAANLAREVRLAPALGTFTLSGTSALLRASKRLTAGTGVFTVTSGSANLPVNYRLNGQVASFTLSGTATALKLNRRLGCTVAAYALAGSNVNLSRQVRLTATLANYTVSGSATNFRRGYRLINDPAAYTFDGTTTALRSKRRLSAEVVTYSLTGTGTGMNYNRVIAPASRDYILTMVPAELTYTRGALRDPYCPRPQNFDRITSPYVEQTSFVAKQAGPYTDRPTSAMRPPKQC